MAAKKCSAKRQDGSACKGHALKDGRCMFHSTQPDIIRRRARGRHKGGVKVMLRSAAPILPDIKLESRADVIELLAKTINELRREQVTPRVASVVGNLCAVVLNALEAAPEAAAQVFFDIHPPSGEVPSDLNEQEYLAGKQD